MLKRKYFYKLVSDSFHNKVTAEIERKNKTKFSNDISVKIKFRINVFFPIKTLFPFPFSKICKFKKRKSIITKSTSVKVGAKSKKLFKRGRL